MYPQLFYWEPYGWRTRSNSTAQRSLPGRITRAPPTCSCGRRKMRKSRSYALRKFTPFALAGACALISQPKDVTGVKAQTRSAFIYGVGADLNITHHVFMFMRAEYRGFVHKSPTWDLATFSGLDQVTHRAEPSIRFGYRF